MQQQEQQEQHAKKVTTIGVVLLPGARWTIAEDRGTALQGRGVGGGPPLDCLGRSVRDSDVR